MLLLAGGIALGPEGLGWVRPMSLGHGLETIVSVVVAVILFEGGLTLDREGYDRAPTVIKRLLTVGALVTWGVTAVAVYLTFRLPLGISLLMGSLVIVTGPTVISPLLRRMQIKQRLHHVLYWEGVLIDIVGVFVALLCYEWLKEDQLHPWLAPVAKFGLRLLVGLVLGLTTGALLVFLLRHRSVPDEHANILVFGGALLCFGVGHLILSESGILSVVVAGFYLALKKPPQLSRVRQFKLQLTEFGIGLVFVLLAAKLELSAFYDPRLLVVLVAIMFVARPLSVSLATAGQGYSTREKLLLSWIAPRGIVAAAMASLFALRLAKNHDHAHYLETLTYAVIVTTVTLQGLTAPLFSRLLGLKRSERRSWLLHGDDVWVLAISRALERAGVKTVTVTPSNYESVADFADPRLAEVESALCFDGPNTAYPPPEYYREVIAPEGSLYWLALATGRDAAVSEQPHATVVWRNIDKSDSEALVQGSRVIDVIDMREGLEPGSLRRETSFLFGVSEGRARLVVDPSEFDPKNAEFAIVLRRRIPGLSQLVAHVEVVEGRVTYAEVVKQLARSAGRLAPQLSSTIEEAAEQMPAAVGNHLAIPHAYVDGLPRSHCLMAVIKDGVEGLEPPDGQRVQLVCLLLSPTDQPEQHLEGLATLGALAVEQDLVDLLTTQRAPERVRKVLDAQS